MMLTPLCSLTPLPVANPQAPFYVKCLSGSLHGAHPCTAHLFCGAAAAQLRFFLNVDTALDASLVATHKPDADAELSALRGNIMPVPPVQPKPPPLSQVHQTLPARTLTPTQSPTHRRIDA